MVLSSWHLNLNVDEADKVPQNIVSKQWPPVVILKIKTLPRRENEHLVRGRIYFQDG